MLVRKSAGWILASALALSLSSRITLAQPVPQTDSGAKQSMRNAGTDTKDAARNTGQGIKEGTRKGYNKTKRGTKKTYYKSKRGTKRAVHKVEGRSDTSPNHPPR